MKKKKYRAPVAALVCIASECVMAGSCRVGGAPKYYEYEEEAEVSTDFGFYL
jgi:hypothetical protein